MHCSCPWWAPQTRLPCASPRPSTSSCSSARLRGRGGSSCNPRRSGNRSASRTTRKAGNSQSRGRRSPWTARGPPPTSRAASRRRRGQGLPAGPAPTGACHSRRPNSHRQGCCPCRAPCARRTPPRPLQQRPPRPPPFACGPSPRSSAAAYLEGPPTSGSWGRRTARCSARWKASGSRPKKSGWRSAYSRGRPSCLSCSRRRWAPGRATRPRRLRSSTAWGRSRPKGWA
mmetsp:Transcript_99531/g.285921  ORF Transcript_99531/g.285921 Transcript_99531/m.285921 type:complete len:229 (+) Transcript_99531:450-1136(+)